MSFASKFKKIYNYYNFKPENIIIEPTNKCNLACPVCFRSIPAETYIPEGFMNLEIFNEILTKSKENVKNISLYFRGEPLLHPEIIRFVELCKEHKFAVNISTNGLLLNKDLMEKIIRTGLDRITIDYDDISGNDYETIRNVKNAEVVLKKILTFDALKESLRSDFPEIVIKALNLGNRPKKIKTYIKRLEDTGIVGKAQISDCFPWPTGKIKPDFPYQLTSSPRVCDMYYQGITITYKGNILACSYDYREDYSIGNIRDFNSVAEVYKETSYCLFRRRLLFKAYQKQKPCSNCLLPILGLSEGEYALNTLMGSASHA